MTSVAPSLAEIREQHEAARLGAEIAQLKATTQIYETAGNYLDNYVDPHWQFEDMHGRPTFPVGHLTDRQGGANSPIFRTEQELQVIRGFSRVVADANAYGKGALETLTNYVIGTGYAYKVAAKDSAGAVETEVVAAAQRIIQEFIDENKWPAWERELFRRSRRDGEFFIGFNHIGAGHTQIRAVEPEQVTESGALIPDDLDGEPTSWTFGIHTPERDVCETLGYSVRWDAQDLADYIPSDRIIHHKVNVDRNVKRGLTDFYPIHNDLESARKLMRNSRDGAAIQAAIAFIKRYPTGTRRDFVQNEISAATDWVTAKASNTAARRQENVSHYSPGSVLSVSGETEYHEGPLASGAANFMTVLQGSLRGIAVRWAMPESMISGDASNANFASSLVAEGPFVKNIVAAQSDYSSCFREVMWKVLEIAAYAGRLRHVGIGPHNLARVFEISVTPPPAESRNLTEETNKRSILNQNGVLSKETWSALEELDYEVEQDNISREKKGKPQPEVPEVVEARLPADLREAVEIVNRSLDQGCSHEWEGYP